MGNNAVGQVILTLAGAYALSDAQITGKPIKPKYFKVSDKDIDLDPTLKDIEGSWLKDNIAGYTKIDNDTVEFLIDIPPEKAAKYGKIFGLYLEDGTLFAIAKPPYAFPPSLRQRLKVQIKYSNVANLTDFKYIPFYEIEQNISIYATFQAQLEFNRQFLSTGILSVPYGDHNPSKGIVNTPLSSVAWSALGMHNHMNYKAMPGLGWFAANVNGYPLQTRHNDYRTFKKADEALKTAPAEPPQSPSLSISEMQDLFKRYSEGNLKDSEKSLFRWDLAYLEAFVYELDSINDKVEDQFSSFRHGFGTLSAFQLLQKALESRITGVKSRFENYPLLPIFPLPNGKYGVLLYRILVEPLPEFNGKTWDEIVEPYELYEIDKVDFYNPKKRFRIKPEYDWENIVNKIPGLDGRRADISSVKTPDGYPLKEKNYAYYHRSYQIPLDAVNQANYAFGWNDRTLFVARSNNPRVFGGVSYLLPLELILRTPLETWNPYNIPRRDRVTGNGTKEDPYTGWNENARYYLTPSEFFAEDNFAATVADTRFKAYMKDANGSARLCYGSGIWIVLPDIPDVGRIRTRFPVYFDALEEGLFGYFLQLVSRQHFISQLDLGATLGEQIASLLEEVESIKAYLFKGGRK